eukprot:TRINITY_DN4640_c0_g5_i2.p1 TRINITY_DN4640_c0_g5~~TRINITY_DN4640_c0_g5_i2.p1  ORF type:complete len:207 (+),score=83.35 TRINITY_DN4640_c0_g5_i2:27-647(+)
MKVVLLLSTLLVATAYAFTDNLADIKVPTANDIGTAFAKSEDALIRQAGSNMIVDVPATTIPPLGLLCKSSHKTVGPCDVSFKVCPHLHHVIHLRYKSDACASGICASSGEHKSADDAAKESLYNLMLKHPSCACGAGNTTIGTCNFKINSCFQLDPSCTTPSFYASATCTKNAVSADYCCAANGEDAAKAAMTALAGKMNMTACM